MSEIDDILTGRVNVKTLTNDLLDSVAPAASMTVDRQPRASARIQVTITGATVGTGLVNIAGTTNETISFSENGEKVGEKDYTNISGITISGIEDGFIEIKAVSRMGQPINQEKTRHSSLPVRFYAIAKQRRIEMRAAGQEKVAEYAMIVAPDMKIAVNDRIYAVSGVFGLTLGQVSFVQEITDFDGLTHHTEAELLPI